MASDNSINRRPLIEVRNVGVSYWLKSGLFSRKAHWPLKDVSFDLYEGDSLGIIGRNGVGKSTLLALLAGVMSPDCGTITNYGATTSLLSLNLGFVNYLSGRENAILGGMFLGMRKKEIEAKLDDIIDFSELDEFFDKPISTYSSGMRARLAFAVAFQISPNILLIDEVTGVGDISFREKSMRLMRERIQSHKNTIVFVSHTPQEVEKLCNRAVWLEDGVARMQGDTRSVLDAYEDFVHTEALQDVKSQVKNRMTIETSRAIQSGEHIERVEFNDATACRFLVEGWGNIESGGPWTIGETASLRFRLDEVNDPKIVLFARTYRAQRVDVALNGHALEGLKMDGLNYREVVLHAPKECFEQENILRFELPDRVSPQSLGDGIDPRPLGIRVYWLEVHN